VPKLKLKAFLLAYFKPQPGGSAGNVSGQHSAGNSGEGVDYF
jgi:hypothetical protein